MSRVYKWPEKVKWIDGTDPIIHTNGCAKCGSELAWWYDAKTDSRRCDQCFGFWRVAWELLKMRVRGWLA